MRRAFKSEGRAEFVKGLRKEITLQQTYVKFDDFESFYASDERFHGLVAKFANLSEVLPQILRLKDHMDRFRYLMIEAVDDLNVIVEQHTAITDAIEKGDGKAAEKLMIVHVRRILEYAEKARKKFPQYFEGYTGPVKTRS